MELAKFSFDSDNKKLKYPKGEFNSFYMDFKEELSQMLINFNGVGTDGSDEICYLNGLFNEMEKYGISNTRVESIINKLVEKHNKLSV